MPPVAPVSCNGSLKKSNAMRCPDETQILFYWPKLAAFGRLIASAVQLLQRLSDASDAGLLRSSLRCIQPGIRAPKDTFIITAGHSEKQNIHLYESHP